MVAVNPVIEYIYDLAREHAEEVKFLGAVAVFVIVVIACNLAKGKT